MSAVTFSPRYSMSLRLLCDASRAQRGRNPALLRVHLHYQEQHLSVLALGGLFGL
jgi:hypothetical protein